MILEGKLTQAETVPLSPTFQVVSNSIRSAYLNLYNAQPLNWLATPPQAYERALIPIAFMFMLSSAVSRGKVIG